MEARSRDQKTYISCDQEIDTRQNIYLTKIESLQLAGAQMFNGKLENNWLIGGCTKIYAVSPRHEIDLFLCPLVGLPFGLLVQATCCVGLSVI